MRRAHGYYPILLIIWIMMLSCSLSDKNQQAVSGGLAHETEDVEVLVIPEPITNYRILPFAEKIENAVTSDTVSITAAPDSYEPASIVIRSATTDLRGVTVKATDLKDETKTGAGDKSRIPKEHIDVKTVKCWYQAGSAGVSHSQNKKKRVLIPELLLNDDSVVRVDYQNQENYLKLTFPEGGRYVWISDPRDVKDPQIPSAGGYPVRDSPLLLPVDIPAGTNKQFWITVKVPRGTGSGTYKGRMHIRSSGGLRKDLSLELRVLPFELSPPYHTSSIFYRSRVDPKLDPSGKGTISSEYKTERQFRRELEDLLAHGVTNPTIYESFDRNVLGKVLRIRNEVGMGGQPAYYLGLGRRGTGNPTRPEELEALRKRIREIVDFFRAYGVPEVYFYGIDEATDEVLGSQRLAWTAVREAGGKVFASGYKGKNVEAMGDIQDVLISAGDLSKSEAAKWHSRGHRIWSYANPQGGVENPELYRRHFGLLLWKNDYDGAATYAYQSSAGNIWNDFDHPVHRDIAFTYPTADGVVGTTQWEGYREGVDDLRYLTTLLHKIARAKGAGNKDSEGVAIGAEKYLSGLEVRTANLYHVRAEMVRYILELDRR